jgi:hypothetical protein
MTFFPSKTRVSSIVHASGFFRRFAAGVAVVAISGVAALVTGVAANAAPPPGDGSLTLTPATGSDQTVATLTTPAPCPAAADSYNVIVTGPGSFNGTITSTQSAGISHTDPFQTQFGENMLQVSQDLGMPIAAGEYDITMQCINTSSFPDSTILASFSTAMIFSDATNYTVLNNGTPSPSPSPSPSPVMTPSPSPSTGPGPSPPPAVTPSPTLSPSPSPVVTPVPGPGAKTTKTKLSVLRIPLPLGLGGFVFPIAHVVPFNATGTVQLKDAGTELGGPVPLISGFAFGSFMFLPRGQYSLSEVFIPTDSAALQSSTSKTVKFRL